MTNWTDGMLDVIALVMQERHRQFERYGLNEMMEDGTGPETRWLLPFTSESATVIEYELRADYEDFEEETGLPTWVHLVREEVAEAFKESDPERLTEELIQVAALCVSWVERIRARTPVIDVTAPEQAAPGLASPALGLT